MKDVNAGAGLCAVYSKRVKESLSLFVKFERQTVLLPFGGGLTERAVKCSVLSQSRRVVDRQQLRPLTAA
jgi:hypothetical protein